MSHKVMYQDYAAGSWWEGSSQDDYKISTASRCAKCPTSFYFLNGQKMANQDDF